MRRATARSTSASRPTAGRHWSTPAEISGSNASICTVPDVGPCNDDQGSDPVVGPDGTIYVAFANGNIPGAGQEQVLFVKCPAAADCSNSASWTPPARVGAHGLDAPGRAAQPERLPEPAVPAAERLSRSGRDDRHGLGRPEQQAVRRRGQTTATTRIRTASWVPPAAAARLATTTSSMRTRRRRDDVERDARHHAALPLRRDRAVAVVERSDE